jgi:GNAT superfamily N-acetyltransferase
MSVTIAPMTRDQCSAVARLHVESIRTGLSAYLGQRFCEALYLAMSDTPHSFVLVATMPGGDVAGFVCGTTSVRGMYRYVLVHGWHRLIPAALAKFLNPIVTFKAIRALLLPWLLRKKATVPTELPEPALVSMAVSANAQGGGVGKLLVAALFQRLRSLGAVACRVWTSEDNVRAKAFYEKCGFIHVADVDHHSGKIRILVARLDMPDRPSSDDPQAVSTGPA